MSVCLSVGRSVSLSLCLSVSSSYYRLTLYFTSSVIFIGSLYILPQLFSIYFTLPPARYIVSATVIWQQGLGHLPGYISHHPDLKFSDIPDGVAAIGAVPGLGWAQILWFAGLLELGPFSVYNRREDRPGAFNDFKWGGNDVGEAYPGLTDENRIQKLTIELQNGRLAMLGVLGMLMGDVVAPGTMGLPTADGIGLF